MAELRTPQGHTLLLPDGAVSIGADPANEVPVAAHLGLAPVHFRLQPWEGGHFIEDAGSGLGTLVNGHAINWKPLAHGDRIVAGELEVIYSESSPSDAASVSATAASAAPVVLLQPPAPPSSSGIAAAPLMSIEASGLQVPMPTASTVAQPPAWLPEDLLPENSHKSAVITENPPCGNPISPAGEVPIPAQGRFPESTSTQARRFRRQLPLAAVLAVLGWAGHAAWQSGNLGGLFQSLQSAWGKSRPSPAGMPVTEPATQPPGNKVAPAPRPLTP